MADPRHTLGMAAEDATAAWLGRCGWQILARRHRPAAGAEVDIVALDPDGVLVGVEVRARRTRRAGAAALSVDARRVARLRRALASVAGVTPAPHVGLRVDLVTVEPVDVSSWRLSRIPAVG